MSAVRLCLASDPHNVESRAVERGALQRVSTVRMRGARSEYQMLQRLCCVPPKLGTRERCRAITSIGHGEAGSSKACSGPAWCYRSRAQGVR